MKLEIIGSRAKGTAVKGGPVSEDHAITGFHSVTLSEEGYEKTAKLLTDVMGYRSAGNEGNRFRYWTGQDVPGDVVDLHCVPDARRGGMGAGVVHHIAFRTPDDDQQKAWHETVVRLGYNVSPVMDRSYFHSIYFREPGGVLFEIATDTPGFTADEPAEQLGQRLMLPAWLETQRREIGMVLPPLEVPAWSSSS